MVNGFPLTLLGKPFEKASVIVYSQVPLLRPDSTSGGLVSGQNSRGCVLEEHLRGSGEGKISD